MCFLPLSFILFYPIPPIIFVFPFECFLCHSAVKSTFAGSKIYFPDGIQHFCYFQMLCTERFSPAKLIFFAWEWCWRFLLIVLQAGPTRTAAPSDSKFIRLSQWCTMGNWGCKLSWMKLQSLMYDSYFYALFRRLLSDISLLPSAFLSEQQFSPFPSQWVKKPVLPFLKGHSSDSRCRITVAIVS